MATAEQMQEALQQIQMLTARIGALENQVQVEYQPELRQQNKTEAHEFRLWGMDRGDAMVDTKGIGQPFTLKGTSDRISVNGPTKCAR